MKKTTLILYFILFTFHVLYADTPPKKSIVTATKRIYIPEFPGSYNPSIIKHNDHYLLTFRYCPNRFSQPWIAYIGVVFLDESFEPISQPQLINTRYYTKRTPCQSEDARIFSHNGKLYLFYNDNMDMKSPATWDRRDMYMTELTIEKNNFSITNPLKLINEDKYEATLWQKNWSPFEWNGELLFSYSLAPHEVLRPNLKTGSCYTTFETTNEKAIEWDYGPLRGGTPLLLVDGEYLAFFHSGIVTTSLSSDNRPLWHYFMGAVTYESEPPFRMTKISALPIINPGFYTYSASEKRVIYPGGFVIDGNNLYVAYGKDDCEVWIATMNLEELKKSMVPVK